MPWKEANVMDLRIEFVTRALREELSFAALCREYGISPKTGYKWKERFLEEGRLGLADRSRRPLNCPQATCEELVCQLVRIKGQHPTWGPKKIREVFRKANRRIAIPSLSTVNRILGKVGLTKRRHRRRPAPHCGRIINPLVASVPNEVWTVDFKGWWYSTTHQRVMPLTVRDAFSRYVLLVQVVADARSETIQACFTRLFRQFGKPLAIRSDNGAPFACTSAPLGLSRLSAWWVALGISLDRIEKGHPEQNGAHERMHRDMALEVEGRVDGDLTEQQAALDVWRREYNNIRPHEALGMRCPAEVYVKSDRRFNPDPVSVEYPLGYLRRRVKNNGCIKLHNRLLPITTAVRGWDVGLQPVADQVFNVWFGSLRLGDIQVRDEKFTPAV
jgi:putative transposase